jgi:hypothetical protein
MSLVYPLLLLALSPNPVGPPPGLEGTALVWAKSGPYTTQGTGVLVDKRNRLLVTAWHVVREEKDLHVLFPLHDGRRLLTAPLPYQELYKSGHTIRAKVIAAHPRSDLAILQLDSLPDGVRELRFGAAAPQPSVTVYFVGNPQLKNIHWDCTIGTTRAIEIKEWEFATGQGVRAEIVEVETSAGLDSGYSGGPVLDGSGLLVGITVAAREQNSPRIYCTSATELRQRLAQSYSTLAVTALRAGDFAAFHQLIAAGRDLSPGDSALVCLEQVIAWLERLASPSTPAFRCVGWIVRPGTTGTHP